MPRSDRIPAWGWSPQAERHTAAAPSGKAAAHAAAGAAAQPRAAAARIEPLALAARLEAVSHALAVAQGRFDVYSAPAAMRERQRQREKDTVKKVNKELQNVGEQPFVSKRTLRDHVVQLAPVGHSARLQEAGEDDAEDDAAAAAAAAADADAETDAAGASIPDPGTAATQRLREESAAYARSEVLGLVKSGHATSLPDLLVGTDKASSSQMGAAEALVAQLATMKSDGHACSCNSDSCKGYNDVRVDVVGPTPAAELVPPKVVVLRLRACVMDRVVSGGDYKNRRSAAGALRNLLRRPPTPKTVATSRKHLVFLFRDAYTASDVWQRGLSDSGGISAALACIAPHLPGFAEPRRLRVAGGAELATLTAKRAAAMKGATGVSQPLEKLPDVAHTVVLLSIATYLISQPAPGRRKKRTMETGCRRN